MIDIYNMAMKAALELATSSPDPSTQNAAILIDSNGGIICSAVNEPPPGLKMNDDRWNQRPAKYNYVEHAERNVIYVASKMGIKCDGLIMVPPWSPCRLCKGNCYGWNKNSCAVI